MENYKGIISTSGTIFGSLIAQKGPKGDTGEKGSTGEKGEKGDQGYTPQKGLDYFTEQDKQEFIEELTLDIHNEKEAFNQNVDNKTNEFNQNASNKMKEFNQNVSAKTEEMINQVVEVEAMVKRINISGASKQETREGYNLVDFSIGGALVNDILTISGDTAYKSYTYNITNVYKNNPNKTLYFSYESIDLSNANIGMVQLIINKTDGTTTYNSLMDRNGKLVPYTIPSDTSDISKVTLGVYANNSSTSGITYTIVITKPILAFEENLPYEQYGASPSIEYEAPIKGAGDNINLIGMQDGSWTENGLTINVKDNEININGTVTASSNVFFTLKESLNLNGKYSFQAGNNIALTGGEYFRLYTGTTGFEVLVAFGALTSLNVKSENIDISGTADRLAIRVNAGTVFNNVTFKPKLEKGTKATPYSPYGQGSIEIKQVNKNFFDGIAEQGALNADGWTADSTTRVRMNKRVFLKKGSYTINVNGSEQVAVYFYNDTTTKAESNSGWVNTPYTFTITTDKYVCGAFRKADNSEITINNINNIQIELGETATEHVEHQSQTKALYTQQPFRAIGDVKDRFVKVDGVDKEQHPIFRKIFDGTENWLYQDRGNGIYRFNILLDNAINLSGRNQVLSNYFLYKGSSEEEGNCFISDKYAYFYSSISSMNDFKSKLTELYNAGTPVYVDYVLATPTLIECIPEQVEVLNDIYSAYGEGMTNIICNNEIEPVIEIVKETKETVQSENDKAISALLARVTELEQLVASIQSTAVEEGA